MSLITVYTTIHYLCNTYTVEPIYIHYDISSNIWSLHVHTAKLTHAIARIYMLLQFYEIMRLSDSNSGGMELRLVGEAVEPRVVLEPDTNGMDFGHTYAGDTCTGKLQLKEHQLSGRSLPIIKLQGRKNGKFSKSKTELTNFCTFFD